VDVSPEQAFAILDEIESPLVRCLVILLSATGLRPSEALALRWSDIKWEEDRIKVKRGFVDGKIGCPKSLASRGTVEMHRTLAAVLLEWRKQTMFAADIDYIFASERKNGKQPRLGSMIVADYVRPAAIRAGVIDGSCPRFGLHNCRHGLATFLTERGTDPKVIQRMLRWSDAKMLQRYAHPRRQAKKAQGEYLGRMFKKGRKQVQKQVQRKRPSRRKGA
ncbi:MAG TPA: site-specific integrase, partial [Terriglobales bacterium]|nr:site-specific integrase [Terriglobales bacterium]